MMDPDIIDRDLALIEELRGEIDPNIIKKKIDLLSDTRLGRNYRTYFQQKLLIELEEDYQISDSVISILSERHNELIQLNANIQELKGLFLDMAYLVNKQGDLYDNIENNVNRAKAYVDIAHQDIKTANVYQKKSRKKIIIILSAVIAGIAGITAPIIKIST